MKVNQTSVLIKLALFILSFALLKWHLAIIAYILFIVVFPYIVALIFRVKVMPSMDMGTFYGSNNSTINFMSATHFEYVPYNKLQVKYREMIKSLPKCRYTIVEIFGDYYYKEVSIDEALEYCCQKVPKSEEFKNEADIDKFVERHINEVMPLNKPQWQMFT